MRNAFVAYPATPNELRTCIRSAITRVNTTSTVMKLIPWEENDISGRPLTEPIFSNIESSGFLVADITRLNFNVTYEIGYAIGTQKRAYLIKNQGLTTDDEKLRKVGIFDTLGYEQYPDSDALAKILSSAIDITPLPIISTPDRNAPVYLIETPVRTEAMVRIVARIKKARLQYRSFTPSEEVRLSAIEAIHHVSSSMGVVIPLASPQIVDSDVHNIRAAFLAGLAHGMSKITLILQDGEGPVPLDLRDLAKTYTHPLDIDQHIEGLALDIFEELQSTEAIERPSRSFLASLSIGDPMAENEFQTLGNYYLQTDEFRRALRGEVNLVVGRKGTGKTALFSQVRNHIRQDRNNIVVDLKPEGYQLIKLKEEVLDYVSEGAKSHLITAFWEYLLLLEVCYKILEKDRSRHLRDHVLYDVYQDLQDFYYQDSNISEGDFSERLLVLSDHVAQIYRSRYQSTPDTRLTTDEITGLVYSHDIKNLRAKLSSYLRHKGGVWILFDNLDKGWSSQGLARGDIMILRCLIDASRKIQREMIRMGYEFHTIIFVRNDVYQLLMDESPDFGKESRASLDWSDPELLREMLRKRFVQNDFSEDIRFDAAWRRLCVSHFDGEETSQYLIERCLMRPRNFLKIFGYCRGFAVNLDHNRIEADDVEKGLRAYSNDLLIEADQELTDIEKSAKELIYQFIGEDPVFSHDELERIFNLNNILFDNHEKILDFLLYYGFLGVRYGGDEIKYIFDVGYDLRILKIFIRKNFDVVRFMLNPAFWPALGIVERP